MKPIKHPPSMIAVAKAEVDAWCSPGAPRPLNRGLVMMILFAFIHRYVTGKTVEESFFKQRANNEPEYMI